MRDVDGTITPESLSARSPILGFLLFIAVPSLLLMDAGAAFLRGWRTATRLELCAIWGGAVVLLLGTCGFTLAKGRAIFRDRWAILAALIAGGTLGVFMMEGVLAMADWPAEPRYFHTHVPQLRTLFRPVPERMPGVHGESKFTTNSLGVRGPEWPPRESAHRIMCIGGSTTECLFLDDEETWPQQLMWRLNSRRADSRVWVGNIGISGYSSIEHLRYVTESPLVGEVDCAVFLCGINDLARFLLGNLSNFGIKGPIWSQSHVWAAVRLVAQKFRARWDLQSEDLIGRNYEARRQKRKIAPVCDRLPDMTSALHEYKGRIREMAVQCRRMGVRTIFLSQPTLWSDDLSPHTQDLFWFGGNARGEYLTVRALREGLDRYNEALRAACSEINAEWVDLTLMSGREEFFYDDCHFNEAGAEEVGRVLSEWLSEPRPATSQQGE